MKKHAVISPCGNYSYQLERLWDKGMPMVLFIMLNPSTADADSDDPTITRFIGFAKAWGFGGLMVGNLWAYRATDPKKLKDNPEINHSAVWLREINEKHIRAMALQCDTVIFAWWTDKHAFDWHVLKYGQLFPDAKAITISKHGKPCHPLYLKKTLTPINFNP